MIAPVLVTGGTGFVGIALVRELTEHGYEVHVLARPSADRSVLADLPVQWHAGDLLDAASIERALEAVAACAGGAGPWLVHNAAVISYRTRDAALQREVNVEGTRRVLRAARKMGVTRAVHVSSVVAVGFSSRGETLDEGAPWNGAQLGLDYVTTKRAAEEFALAAAEELDLRVVNPGAIFGPSPRPANTARFLRKIAAGALGPIAPPGVMSPVGLRDVATGIRLALERGRAGRRYLLCESTLSLKDLFRRAQALLELKPTRFALSHLHVIILGIIQGIAEFLPISSSGHIVIANAILTELPGGGKLPDTNDLNITLHAGTLLSILVIYWRRIVRLLSSDRAVIPKIIVGTLPVVASGLILTKHFPHWLDNPLLAGCMLPVTGLLLLWAARRPLGELDYTDLTYGKALVIGLFQAVAPLPGISRSGTTIAAGLAVGLSRQAAATFSFLLAIPALGGAIFLKTWQLIAHQSVKSTPVGTSGSPLSSPGTLLAIGAAVSFVVGLLALCWLIRWLEKGRIQYFAYWCIPVGIAVVVWQLVKGA